MKPCQECGHIVSEQAVFCPNCGQPYPAMDRNAARGFEYKSEATIFGLPLLHICFKYRLNRAPVPAKGIVAIGQFAAGLFTISQFGVGLVSISQFTVAGWALAQFALAYNLIAQFGLYLHHGRGQMIIGLSDLLHRLL